MALESIWSAEFIFANISKMLVSLVFSLLTATLVSFSADTYGASDFASGMAVGIFIIAALISRIFAGYLASSLGRARLLTAGTAAYFVATALYCIPMGFASFIAVRIVHGFAFGVATNVLVALVTDCIPRDRRGEGLGIFALSSTVSSAVGPFLGVTLAHNVSYEAMFVACALSSLGGFIASIPLRRIPEASAGECGCDKKADGAHAEKGEAACARTASPKLSLSDFFELSAIPLCILLMAFTICSSSVNAYAETFASYAGFPFIAPWYFVAYSTTMLLTRPSLGRLHDRRGARVVVIPCLAVFCLGLVVLGTCTHPAGIIVAAALISIGFGGGFSSMQASIVGEARDDRVDVAASTFYVFGDVGLGIGPMLAGSILPLVGYRGMFFTCAAVVVVGIAYYLALDRGNAKR